MRGIQFGILTLFWLIGMGIILSGLMIAPALKSGQKYDSLIKTDVYMMSSAMDAATTYLNASLQFSGYQSCYDLMGKGGNSQLAGSNKVSYGERDYGTVPDRAAFAGSLSSSIQSYLNSYASSGYTFSKSSTSKYGVNLPSYKLSLSETGAVLTAAAQASGKMSSQMYIRGGNYAGPSNIGGKVTIYKEAGISANLHLNCLAAYDRMKAASDELGAALEKLLDDAKAKLEAGAVKDTVAGCGKVMDEETAAAKNAVADMSNEDRMVEVLDALIDMELVPTETETDGPNAGKYVCKFIDMGGSSYIAAKVTMAGAGKYPVNNGKEIAYEPITPVFAVTAGTVPASGQAASGQPAAQPSGQPVTQPSSQPAASTGSTQLPATGGGTSWFASDAGDSCKFGKLQYGCGQGNCPTGSWAHTAACNNLCLGDTYGNGGGPDDVNVWYAAMRWESPNSFWCGRRIVVTNDANGKQVVVAIEDKGPAASLADRAVDLSKRAYNAIEASGDSAVTIAFADADTPLGPV